MEKEACNCNRLIRPRSQKGTHKQKEEHAQNINEEVMYWLGFID